MQVPPQVSKIVLPAEEDWTVEIVDWTGRFTGHAVDVARPRNTDEVAAILRSGYAVTTRGGNTGLVGGAVPATGRDTVLLDTAGLTEIGELERDTGQITVGAGVTLQQLQDKLRGTGWAFGVDLGARGSATIGGMCATNAGGIRVIRYGMMRAQVIGLQAVLPHHSVHDLSGLLKNNTGYPLSQLLIGSEGTLGVITAARLRLHPQPPPTMLGLLPIDTLAHGLALVGRLRRAGATLHAAEVMDQASMGRTDAPWYLLVEADDLTPIGDADPMVASTPAEQRRLWEPREGLTEAWGRRAAEQRTVVQKFDVCLPSRELDAFAHDARRMGPEMGMFGHLADGNLHVEVIDPHREWDDVVLRLVAQYGGSISAEHGIGQAKRDYLHLSRSVGEIALMRALKAAVDPADIMNPGVLFIPPM